MYEAQVALDSLSHEPTAHLERVAQFHVTTIRNLEHANKVLRQQLLADEEKHEADLQSVRDELSRVHTDAIEHATLAKEHERRGEEISRLAKRVTALQSLREQYESDINNLRQQIDTLMKTLTARTEEVVELRRGRVGGAVAVSISEEKIIQAISKKGWWGNAISRTAIGLDFLGVRAGRVLHGNSILRLSLIIYLILLHLYVFHVVVAVVHHLPSEVGSDVHAHLRSLNH